MAQQRFLVTGGAGFIGSNIVGELIRRGMAVRVFDNFSTGRRENLREFGDAPEIFEGDLRSYHAVREAVAGVDVVLHQAALPSVPRSVRDPITSNDVNTNGTLNLLHAAREAGVHRLVYASSSSVYGDAEELPKHEGMAPNPLSPYAVSKLAGEYYCRVFARVYGLETVCLRYFNVFGPRQDPGSQYSAVIPKFITAMLRGEAPVIYGDGEQSRDFTYVSNVVEANLLAASVDCEPGLALNCACHERTSLNVLVERLNQILGLTIRPVYRERRTGDIQHSFASIDRARGVLGYAPAVGFVEGLEKTVAWYRAAVPGGAKR
ncbi:MAG TPA: SDR family oxidoreductase [Bacteroidota bacterium]|nr:SDR family oxidoreductase [Bacteroidota bacterium]